MDDLSRLEKSLVEKIVPWDRYHSWVHGVCVVTFDLELGQAIENIYPGHVQLSETDKTNICYLAFPDSNSGVMGDSQFHFRIRLNQSKRVGHLASSRIHSEFNRRCPTALQFDPNYLFGFAYFRQVKPKLIYICIFFIFRGNCALWAFFRHNFPPRFFGYQLIHTLSHYQDTLQVIS